MYLSVVIPAYKEAENLKNLLPKLNVVLISMKVEYEVLVIDTIEPIDDTMLICMQYGAKCINRRGGNSYGDAMRTGFADAIGERIVVMDADGSHNPTDIVKFYKEVSEHDYDLVIGSRYCKGGNSFNNPISKFMSWVLNITYRIVFSLKVRDISDSFRMYDAKKLKSINLECSNFDVVEEIIIRLKMKNTNFTIKEVPIYFDKRVYGESKRDLFKFVASYIKTMSNLYRIERKNITNNYEKQEEKRTKGKIIEEDD